MRDGAGMAMACQRHNLGAFWEIALARRVYGGARFLEDVPDVMLVSSWRLKAKSMLRCSCLQLTNYRGCQVRDIKGRGRGRMW